jgi:hypothetical protein
MDPQQLGRILAALGSPAGQHVQHLQPWFLAAIIFALQALLEELQGFRHDW